MLKFFPHTTLELHHRRFNPNVELDYSRNNYKNFRSTINKTNRETLNSIDTASQTFSLLATSVRSNEKKFIFLAHKIINQQQKNSKIVSAHKI
jgi:hypothetical protein